jgi:hypothetical protein
MPPKTVLTAGELNILKGALTALSDGASNTLHSLDNIADAENCTPSMRRKFKSDIKGLRKTIQEAGEYVVEVDEKLRHGDRERRKLDRHMKEARVLCDAIREVRREEREEQAQRGDLTRRNTVASGPVTRSTLKTSAVQPLPDVDTNVSSKTSSVRFAEIEAGERMVEKKRSLASIFKRKKNDRANEEEEKVDSREEILKELRKSARVPKPLSRSRTVVGGGSRTTRA